MKFLMPMAAAVVAAGLALPAFAQTGNDTDDRARFERCEHVADPGLKAQCLNQAYTGQDRARGLPDRPADAPMVPTNPGRPDIVPGRPDRR
ncbi:MAG: hypothetical protein ACREF6_11805 [Alphaproteobacteria bacterium]